VRACVCVCVYIYKHFINDRLNKVLVGKPEGERDHLGDPGVDGRIILRWIFRT